MRKILLHTDIVFCNDLSYDDAKKALELASQSIVAEHVTFYIKSGPGQKGWNLVGHDNLLTELFVKDPDKFVIEV